MEAPQSTSKESDTTIKEINYWKERRDELQLIRKQLQQPEVERIVSILSQAKSSHTNQFVTLARKVLEAFDETNDNLKFLQLLYEPCTQLQDDRKPLSTISSTIVPQIIDKVRFIWIKSRFYNTRDRLTQLYRKIFNEIIARLTKEINLSDVFQGQAARRSRDKLEECEKLLQHLKSYFIVGAKVHHSRSNTPWILDQTTIFAEVDGFLQRCRDLSDVCTSQITFLRVGPNNDQREQRPIVHGRHGPDIERGIKEAEQMYLRILSELEQHGKHMALDPRELAWFETFNTYKHGLKAVEALIVQSLDTSFEHAGTIKEGVDLLQIYHTYISREPIRRAFDRRTRELYKMFNDDLLRVKRELGNRQRRPLYQWHPNFAGLALWAQELITRVEQNMRVVDEAFFLPQVGLYKNIKEGFEQVCGALQLFIKKCFLEWTKRLALANPTEMLQVPLIKRSTGVTLQQGVGEKGDTQKNATSATTAAQDAAGRSATPTTTGGAFQLPPTQNKNLLEVNFKYELLIMFQEIMYWSESLKFEIPLSAMQVFQQSQDLFSLRETVTLLVKFYNKAVGSLSPIEAVLFKDQINLIDKKYQPAINKFDWTVQASNIQEYVNDCQHLTEKIGQAIRKFHEADKEITVQCKHISKVEMFYHEIFDEAVEHATRDINTTNMGAAAATATATNAHGLSPADLPTPWQLMRACKKFLKTARKDILAHYREIQIKVFGMKKTFKFDGEEIMQAWLTFCRNIDVRVEKSLTIAVKNGLHKFVHATTGSDKQHPHRAVIVRVLLSHETKHVTLHPTWQRLMFCFNAILQNFTNCVASMSRIVDIVNPTHHQPKTAATVHGAAESGLPHTVANAEKGATDDAAPPGSEADGGGGGDVATKSQELPLHKKVEQDELVIDMRKLINDKLTEQSLIIDELLKIWRRYSDIWTVDKMTTVEHLELSGFTTLHIERMMKRYTELSTQIDSMDQIAVTGFILLDFDLLKKAVIAHCRRWKQCYSEMLFNKALKEYLELKTFLLTNAAKLLSTPTDLQEFGRAVELHKKLVEMAPTIEARFPPLDEMYTVLRKYYLADVSPPTLNNNSKASDDITTPDDDEAIQPTMSTGPSAMLYLKELWEHFKAALTTADESLKEAKDKFKDDLYAQNERFRHAVQDMLAEFEKNGPYRTRTNPPAAHEYIKTVRSYIENMKAQEKNILSGLSLFGIDAAVSVDLQRLESDLSKLKEIWNLNDHWEKKWNFWKSLHITQLQESELEQEASETLKSLAKLRREVSATWTIVGDLLREVDEFRKTLPLVTDLRNTAMRERHWRSIKVLMQAEFDEQSEAFSLQLIVQELQMSQRAEDIGAVSIAATKELQIEQALKRIQTTWGGVKGLQLTIVPHLRKGQYKLKPSEEISQKLDEDNVTLSTVKPSRYAKPFAETISIWEKKLSLISETIEVICVVQRAWMYLEQVFMGDDIRRQLPMETVQFEEVNDQYCTLMQTLNEDRRCIRLADDMPDLIKTLDQMQAKLERVQRSLEMYLEIKRQNFPRFYFISNDDLLEVLGQTRDPEAVQFIFPKCFANINEISIQKTGQRQSRHEATAMKSSDNETVEFGQYKVLLSPPVESWLLEIERAMRSTLRAILTETRNAMKKMGPKRLGLDAWLKAWPGQLTLTASQIQYTSDVTKSLIIAKETGNKAPLRATKKRQLELLDQLSEIVRNLPASASELDDAKDRAKLAAMIVLEVHGRDVLEKLIKLGVDDPVGFEWICQLRFYWDKDKADCVVRQNKAEFLYGYEYIGNPGRLVITPLTDRCYMTLTNALFMNRGGSPKGPAGTGKTETVKDLGRALGQFVIVINCSEGLDYKSMGRMFAGLAQSGLWGCFDEFNRINIEVLSVVAQQILCILSAMSAHAQRFTFEGHEIKLNMACGVFITMNPGYAGRTELPDNLKAQFRPIAMVVPDSTMIAEIILFGEGFQNTKVLAKKVFTLYQLAIQQLSKQFHYDFGLRGLVAVLRYAGKKKRAWSELRDDEVLLLAMRDMNVAKLTAADLPLFNGIVNDLFPETDPPVPNYDVLLGAVKKSCEDLKLQVHEPSLQKTIQLYETINSRHSVMVVGESGTGKTSVWKCLQGACNSLRKQNVPSFVQCAVHPINPKSITLGELYGQFDHATNEWRDGILSATMRMCCTDRNPIQHWIMFDGPVDTLWIESMNSVMDDNKVLTLINGERIKLTNYVLLLFEVGDLSSASPATVSRCGMVFFDYADLGYEPMLQSWLQQKSTVEAEVRPQLFACVDKLLRPLLKFMREQKIDLGGILEWNAIQTFTRLCDVIFSPTANNLPPLKDPMYLRVFEMFFIFCSIWSIGGAVDEDDRKKIDNFIREHDQSFPNRETIYEYFVNTQDKSWAHWEQQLNSPEGAWQFDGKMPFYKIIVPTVDTQRYAYLIRRLVSNRQPVLVTGPVGTGKTSIIQEVVNKLDRTHWMLLAINLSARTTSANVQNIIESRLEKRLKGIYQPIGGRVMLCVLDDFNMPQKDSSGSQPPLELMRQWIDYGFWYDRAKQSPKHVQDITLMAAQGPPGGGRQVISARVKSRFSVLNLTFPQQSQIRRIYGTMLTHKLEKFSDEAKGLTNTIVDATLEMYNAICQKMLPTPTKIHYLFNMRDISKVFQGLLRSDVKLHDARASLTRLWIHETHRTFCDRLVDEDDRQAFFAILQDKLGTLFNTTFGGVCPDKYPPIFCDFISSHPTDDPDKPRPYQDVQDTQQLKRVAEVFLEDKNSAPGNIPMKLILFRDAIEYVTRIVRVIEQPRGNMLLIGMGGSGRQSLARLAAFICGYKCFSIEVTKNYRHAEFREDIKKLYWSAGVLNRPTVFLMNDKQVVEPSFLEDIHNILSSGEVTSLYKPEEFEEVRRELAEHVVKAGFPDTADSIFAFLIDRVRYNIRIVLCFSPIGREFRDYIRMYPAIVSCTTICFIDKWPEVALLEVADRLLMSVPQMDDANVRTNIAKVMAIIHKSVEHYLVRMFREHKRQNYVTPTNYLELVNGYIKTLAEKRQEIGGAITKLRNGVLKIVETTEKVEVMSIELADAKVKVFQFQAQCDEYLVSLVQEKKQADEQQKSVAARSEKIQIEKAECEKIAKVAEDELSEAMPLLDEANKALEALNKKDITEIKSYGRPPTPVELVLEAVLILRQNEPSWAEAKKQLADANFIRSLMDFDKDHIPDRVLKKVGTYVKRDDFQPEYVGKISTAAKSLCLWVRAMEAYGRIYRVVEPKRLKWQQADAALKSKLADLESAERRLDEINRKVGKLKEMYEQKLKQKEELKARAQDLETKLDRAAKLVAGLADERDRWEAKIEILEDELQYVVGDCLVAAAFLSYCGPFLSEYREQMTTMWLQKVQELEIPCTPSFSFGTFLCDPNSVREWNIQGLPSDSFSTENGIIVTRGARWPLIIDPQGQALKWIRRMEEKRQLKIIDPQMPDYMRIIENAIIYGIPVLLKNVQEELDPSLEPVLSKSIMKKGNLLLMKLGDKEVEYNPEFRFYMVTKMSNPHYSPEVSTKTTIVNFAVKEQGLEEQLLSIVVSKLEPELQHKKEDLVVRIASGKKRLVELEDVILKLLNESEGSLLEDESLVRTLQTSKSTSIDVSEQLATSETTEKKIDTAREQYRPSAQRSSILFFVINDLSKVDPMYTFSLDAYIQLYGVSIDKSQRSNLTIKERILTLNNYHTEAVYRYVCRGLFERHKLLFSFHMCVKILESQEKLVVEEYKFFLRGAQILDRSKQQDNPCNTWLPNTAWDNVTELERLPGGKFRGIANSFEQFNREWQQVFQSPTPENAHFPGEWEATVNQQQRMLIIRSIRPDRTSAVVTTYVATHLGHQFVEPPVLHMKTIVADSNSRSPIVFILSPGADPVTILTQQAEIMGMSDRLRVVSLGQGQAPVANRLLQHGIKNGDWVFLANCHLSLSWMPELEKFVDTLQTADVNSDFRLWLSSDPSPDFPISILQAGIKLTTEPPKGVKANLKRLYNMIDDRSFPNCSKPSRYKRLLFSLCFFHTILIERRKFGELGFNISYSFNDSDFQVSENLLSVYLDQYEEIPWDALKFIIAEINYGGHVTDDWDRRLLQTYANDFFNTRVTTEQCYHLTSLKDYYIPLDGSLSHYKEYISILPQQDHPEVFGQHPNAEIASEIRESDMLFATLLSLRPQGAAADSEGGGGGTRETSVLQLSADIRDRLPDLLEIEAAAKLMGTTEPLNVVLFQEMERYNAIMKGIKSSLAMLEKGIHGLVVMSTDLENIFNNLYFGQVPASWARMYPSTKGLGNWTRDLVQRVEQLKEWATTTHPPILFWLAGFTFPTGFLTAVLQTAARKNSLAVDALGWDFSVLLSDDVKLRTAARDGIYVRGMYLEGAGWDFKMQCLQDPLPMMLVTPMPVVHFKPTEMKRTKQRPNYYTCPCYYYPVRADNSKHNSFIVGVDLRSGQYSSDHWVKRGAALLLSLSY